MGAFMNAPLGTKLSTFPITYNKHLAYSYDLIDKNIWSRISLSILFVIIPMPELEVNSHFQFFVFSKKLNLNFDLKI